MPPTPHPGLAGHARGRGGIVGPMPLHVAKVRQTVIPFLARQVQPYRLEAGDAVARMADLPDASVHLIVTDPPYFIDGMGADWDDGTLARRAARAGVVGSLPVGMKFDPGQARAFGRFMAAVAGQAIRVLKPGGFFIAFSQARLYHRLAVAAEDAGFEVRDMIGWTYTGQAKAFSMDHFIRKMPLPEAQKAALAQSMKGRKTPQLRPQIEPMVLAQRPREGTFVQNWQTHGTGLMDATQTWEGKFPGNVIYCPKPTPAEKGADNAHMTVKPVRLIEHLVRLFSAPGQVVLDPFAGSGTHGVASLRAGRAFIGFDIEESYIALARRRMEGVADGR
jgi:site-specific DNA-methyltransferase (adenine-specific)